MATFSKTFRYTCPKAEKWKLKVAISTVEEILDDFRQGEMVLMMDDQDRENEGDLIIAADVVTPEHITFFARHGDWFAYVCLALTASGMLIFRQKAHSHPSTKNTIDS